MITHLPSVGLQIAALQWQECPPTCDTRLTGGTRLAHEAASACKAYRRIESQYAITLKITHLPSDYTDSECFTQRRECPPTCDTRLTGGSRVAREAASACKRWRIESGLPISCGDRTLPRHDTRCSFMQW